MAEQYVVASAAAKVSLGAADGNQVARILRRGAIVPEGIPEGQLVRLAELKIIRKVEVVAEVPAPKQAGKK